MGVMTAISGSTTLVASRRPPSPVSSTTTSTPARANATKRHRRHGFEKARMRVDFLARQQPFGRRVNRFEGRAPRLRSEIELAIDLNALARIEQGAAKCIEPGAEPGHAQRRSHHGAGGAFAVGAGDVDEAPARCCGLPRAASSVSIRARSHLTVFSSGPREKRNRTVSAKVMPRAGDYGTGRRNRAPWRCTPSSRRAAPRRRACRA